MLLWTILFWIANAAGWAVAYLLGATPTGYLAGRLLKGIDIRRHGSGSTGATNVLRTLGAAPALVVLVVDVLKGVAAIVLARRRSQRQPRPMPQLGCRGRCAWPGSPRCWAIAARCG